MRATTTLSKRCSEGRFAGGSAFGAELIRRELEITRKAGKPVIVSMSDVAASGGYWVSTSSDEVLADPATITGSIGVFGLVPTFDKTLDSWACHTGGRDDDLVGGGPDLRRPLDPRFGQVIQASVGHIYQEFLARAAASRHATAEQIEEVAQGRVWTGRQAHERHLVDGFGGLAAPSMMRRSMQSSPQVSAPCTSSWSPKG